MKRCSEEHGSGLIVLFNDALIYCGYIASAIDG